MAGKKAKDLDQLIRVNGWGVDERRRELGVFLAREAEMIEARAALDRQMEAERAIAAAHPEEAGFTFGAFAGHHRFMRETLDAQIARLHQEVEAARERLAEAYRQLKVYEEVRKSRAEAEAKDEAKREQEMLDEIALNQHRRK